MREREIMCACLCVYVKRNMCTRAWMLRFNPFLLYLSLSRSLCLFLSVCLSVCLSFSLCLSLYIYIYIYIYVIFASACILLQWKSWLVWLSGVFIFHFFYSLPFPKNSSLSKWLHTRINTRTFADWPNRVCNISIAFISSHPLSIWSEGYSSSFQCWPSELTISSCPQYKHHWPVWCSWSIKHLTVDRDKRSGLKDRK